MVYNKFFTLGGIIFSFPVPVPKMRIMTSYLLLRNNKESGPYNFDELVSQHLKAYDLVWVKGKSAAWRYPGEIAELKDYAPPVEEQPYDRFFKKPGETRQPAGPKAEPSPVSPEPSREDAPSPAPVESQPVFSNPVSHSRKSVFVTLPVSGPGARTAKEPAPEPADPYRRYQPSTEVKPEEPEPVAKTITITESPVAAEIKYSQPLDEIKEMYVKTLQERKQRLANKAFMLQAVRRVAVVAAIVGAGILIGYSLRPGPATKLLASQEREVTDEHLNQSNAIQEEEPAPSTGELSADGVSEPEVTPAVPLNPEVKKSPGRAFQQAGNSLTPGRESIQDAPVQKSTPPDYDAPVPGAEVDAVSGARSRKLRGTENEEQAITEKVDAPKAVMSSPGITSQVKVKSNNYKIVAFGGIRDLQLTVYNESKYVLDNVAVELQYLKPSEEPLRIDVIQFRSVAPGGSLTIRMPDTNRGVKVRYRILNILSTQSAKELAGL